MAQRHARAVDPDEAPAHERGDAEALQRARRLGRERRRIGGQHALPWSTSSTRAARGSIVRKSRRSVSRAISAIWPAISTPVGPAPTMANVSHAARAAGSCSSSAASKAARMRRRMSSAPSSVLSSGANAPPVLAPEVGVVRAGRDDQRVVGHQERRGGVAGGDGQLAPLDVDRGDLAQDDAHVAAALEDRAQRRGDLARGQRARGHLVGERLEEMEVAPVDQGDVGPRAAQVADRLQAAEAAADDHHPESSVQPSCRSFPCLVIHRGNEMAAAAVT